MAAVRWLLLTLLLNAPHISVSHSAGLNLGGNYEVVRPIRLHSVNKRDTQLHRPQRLAYALTVGGRPLELHLERNDELLTKDYTETHYLENGARVSSAPDHIDNCYYQGRIEGEEASEASISTCDGLRGFFRSSGQRFLISPLSSEAEGDHAVVTLPQEQNSPPRTCGVTNNTWATDEEPPSRNRAKGLAILYQRKYTELYLVADVLEFKRMGKDKETLRRRVFELVNFVNMAYKPLQTFVALIGLEIWTNGNKILISSNTGQNLENFRSWRNADLMKRKPHDVAHLISGQDFAGGTVGLAYVGALCTEYSVGVVQDHADSMATVGATLAHELGHNLGMSHDYSSCECSGENCIMEPSVKSWSVPRDFSSCSRRKYDDFLLSRSVNCLLDKPDYKTLLTSPVCGNGLVEEGELCDCGSSEECKNPCCNPSTCQLSAGSQCAEGECCENCKILPRSRECREETNKCDLAEFCDGKSAVCPEDLFVANGAVCDDGRGYCYNGECPQRLHQCQKMYGPGAIEGERYCFEANEVGLFYGYCKRPSKREYIKCAKKDIYCGKLYCHNGNENPIYGGWVKYGNCKSAHFEDFTKDYGQVETGTKCGEGQVCSQGECVTLETAFRTEKCSAKCPGHSVCNHKGECQCEPGWKPPNCDAQDKDYRSVVVENSSPGLQSRCSSVLALLLLLSVSLLELWL